MIERLEGFADNICAFVCHEHVTEEDYTAVLIPAIVAALRNHDMVRLYYETASDFSGMDTNAVWQDTMIGKSHLLSWDRLVVVTDIEWIKHTVQIFGFLMPAQLRVFPLSESARARRWISED